MKHITSEQMPQKSPAHVIIPQNESCRVLATQMLEDDTMTVNITISPVRGCQLNISPRFMVYYETCNVCFSFDPFCRHLIMLMKSD